MPYEKYLDRIHEINHQIVVARRITAKRLKREQLEDAVEVMAFVLLGILCIGLLYFFIAWGGTYR